MDKFQSNSAVIGYECTCNEENNTGDKKCKEKKKCNKDLVRKTCSLT